MTSTPSPFRGRWLLATLVILLGALLMLGLGLWQVERLQLRRAANAQILARLSQPAQPLDGGALNPDEANLRRATVRGVYDFEQEIVLRNRTYGDAPGVHVLTPLRITGSDAAVLVDRGWLPFEFSGREQRMQFHLPPGEVEVQGILRQSQSRRNTLSPVDPALSPDRPRLEAWFRVDLPRIQEQLPYRLLPLYLEEEPAAGDTVRWLPRPDPDIRLDEGSHLFYAVQWFAFAMLLPLVYAFLFRVRTNVLPKLDG
jgi:surfeit locus 1 family protein